MLLEYSGYGQTLPALTKFLNGYALTVTRLKRDDDGSIEVMKFFRDKEKHSLHVCGVNISACVLATVEGLVGYGYHVKVLKKAWERVSLE
jgi:hypothetical protein